MATIHIKPARKDGKHLVSLNYETKQLRKILTPADIQALFDTGLHNFTTDSLRYVKME